mmetsp:Transcript_2484/g.5723  ORF Transcript_2484/g.5723 Transcript_2484/m.5723 type:complete len:317 (-) Transcript_2484:47-997(-)
MQGFRTSVSLDSPLTHRSLSTAPHSRVNSSSRSSKDLLIVDPDRSGASSSFKLDSQELIEQVYNDNRVLRKRVTELEQSREELEASYQRTIVQLKRNLEAKVTALERSVIDKNEIIRGLKGRVVRLQASHSSSLGRNSINMFKVEGLLENMREKIDSLTTSTKENFSFIREQLDLIDGNETEVRERDYEQSSIQEEAVIKPVRATHSLKRPPTIVSINLSKLESSLESIETNKFSSIQIDESGLELEDSIATPDLRKELRKQKSVIQKHEAFIKQLKSTLEALLGERLGSKKHSPEWRQELMELRTLLKFDESLRS